MDSPVAPPEGIAVLRFVPEPILVFDRAREVILANDLACELLGCTEEALRGMPLERFLAHANEGARERVVRMAQTGHVARLCDVVLSRFDGRNVRADIAVRAIHGANAFLLMVSDVRTSAGVGSISPVNEEVLLEHGPFVANEENSAVVCIKSADGVYLDVTSAVVNFTPGREVLLGHRDREVWDQQLTRFIEETDRMAFARPGTILRLQEREGLLVTRVYKAALSDGTGRRLMFLLHLDVRRQEEERQRLIDADQRHRAFLAASSDLLLLTNEEGVVLDSHAGADIRLLGALSSVLGNSFDTLFPPEAAAEIHAAMAVLKRTGEPQEVRLVLGDDDDDERHYDARVVACGGRRVVLVVRDVTQRERARALEARLARADRLEAIGVLAGGIGHDFNNILSVVASFAELLRRSDVPLRAQHFAGEILLAASRGRDLATELVAFARSGEPHKRSTELGPLLDEAARALVVTYPGVAWVVQVPSSVPKVFGDPSQLHRVIVNLAKNAADALHDRPGGKVTLSLGERKVDERDERVGVQPGRYVVLSVKDEGAGIDAATLSRIFDPFFTRRSHGEGTGLGLSVVHSIVRAHEGGVHVTSVVGQGTSFEVLLPAAEAATEHALLGASAPVLGRLLVVEDDQNVGRSLALLLQSSGYHVELEPNPTAALSRFVDGASPVDLVITDLSMPEIDGLELARRLRTCAPRVPVVLLSGRSSEVTRDALDSAGIRAVLSKPISLNEIEGTLRRLISTAKAPRTPRDGAASVVLPPTGIDDRAAT